VQLTAQKFRSCVNRNMSFSCSAAPSFCRKRILQTDCAVFKVTVIFPAFKIMILSYTLILPMSQLQLMTSQIRWNIEYLIHTNNILMLILYSKSMINVAPLAVLIRFNDNDLIMTYFFVPPCIDRLAGAENPLKKLFVYSNTTTNLLLCINRK